MLKISAASLGSPEFKADYGLRLAYMSGAMYKGIASQDLVIAMGKSGLIGFFGSGGLPTSEIESAILRIQSELRDGERYGMNLLSNLDKPSRESEAVDLYLHHGVRHVEAAAFTRATPSLVRYRVKGIRRNQSGAIETPNHVVAKVSRPEVATVFMEPPPETILRQLVERGQISEGEAELGQYVPLAGDICVEADSGGHTDQGVACTLIPAIMAIRDEVTSRHGYQKRIRVGAAGGIGTPNAAASAFVLGADFVVTGSINQCTVEAGTSDDVKDLLQQIGVQDTAYAPAGDMFETGAKVQVVRRGLLFPARANKLFDLYQHHDALDEIDPKTLQQIQDKYFEREIDAVWRDVKAHYLSSHMATSEELESNAKRKMALIFKWYFFQSTRLAMQGASRSRVNYQIHCGPALGAFNQWVKGTPREPWRNRRVADIADHLMSETALFLNRRFSAIADRAP